MNLHLQPARVATYGRDGEQGLLVWADRRLVAVLVHLSAEYGDDAAQWHLEAAFGRVAHPSTNIFANLDEAQAWIEDQLRPAA
ncbi:hypothetical protein [Methylobacterium oryzisoli]|uniref:hypothetical protein n=1 Tax=Methylobacterium oryzisoli TaxID=3385502 RepID=UPI0038929C69